MSYKLRFVQRFQLNKKKEFLDLEREFIKLERDIPEFPKGIRYFPHSSLEPENTLIWECELATLQEVKDVIQFLESDIRHQKLYNLQLVYFLESRMEIYERMEV